MNETKILQNIYSAVYQDKALNRHRIDFKASGWQEAIINAISLTKAGEKLIMIEFVREAYL